MYLNDSRFVSSEWFLINLLASENTKKYDQDNQTSCQEGMHYLYNW